jgi:hypothetical protein
LKKWLCQCAAVNEWWRTSCKDCHLSKEAGNCTEAVIEGLLNDLKRLGNTAMIVLACAMPAYASEWDLFYRAIQQVETGGCSDPANAVGDGGRSIGPYQIQKAYWEDSRTEGVYSQCKQDAYARKVMRRYWQRWCPIAWSDRSWETMARIHSGGPKGHKRKSTREYWYKVKKAMEKIKENVASNSKKQADGS